MVAPEKICFVCKDTAVEADTVFENKPVHSWHLSEFERNAMMSNRSIEREGTEMPKKDTGEKVRELNAQGCSDREVSEKLGIARSVAAYHRTRLGLPIHKKDVRANGNGSAPVRKLHRKAAIVKAGPQIAQITQIAEASGKASGNGHIRCRVAMFEVEGSESSVLAAIEAVKAALSRAA